MVIITDTEGLVARYFDLSCETNEDVFTWWSRTWKESDVGIFGAVYFTKDYTSDICFSDNPRLVTR